MAREDERMSQGSAQHMSETTGDETRREPMGGQNRMLVCIACPRTSAESREK
jgi:hypothetical protein